MSSNTLKALEYGVDGLIKGYTGPMPNPYCADQCWKPLQLSCNWIYFNIMIFFLFIFSIDTSIKEPGLTFSSFLNDRISVIIEIILSTSLKFLSLFNLSEGQLANIRKFFFELSNLFLSQISSVMKGINGCNKISICLKT